jgi:hypothetical protein
VEVAVGVVVPVCWVERISNRIEIWSLESIGRGWDMGELFVPFRVRELEKVGFELKPLYCGMLVS